MGDGSGAHAVKVVIINTQFVETDARSFKSVVQTLTGKDSSMPAAQPPPRFQPAGGASYKSPVLSPGMSFKDFERMINELPPFDELTRIYRG